MVVVVVVVVKATTTTTAKKKKKPFTLYYVERNILFETLLTVFLTGTHVLLQDLLVFFQIISSATKEHYEIINKTIEFEFLMYISLTNREACVCVFCLFVYLSIYLYIYISTYLPTYLSIYLSIYSLLLLLPCMISLII